MADTRESERFLEPALQSPKEEGNAETARETNRNKAKGPSLVKYLIGWHSYITLILPPLLLAPLPIFVQTMVSTVLVTFEFTS